MGLQWTENWKRSYKITIGTREFNESAFYTCEVAVTSPTSVTTEEDYTTIASGARTMANLASENYDERGFTFQFDTTQHISKESNDSENTTLTLYNLDSDMVEILNQEGCLVIVEAGYGGYVEQIYSGDVVKVVTSRNGADKVYKISCASGATDLKNTYVSVSYSESMSDKDIIEDMISRLPSTTTGTLGTEDLADTYKTGGRTFSGQLINGLEKLLSSYNLSYAHINGKMVVVPYSLDGDNYSLFEKTNYNIPETNFKSISNISERAGIGSADSKAKKTKLSVTTFFLPVDLGQFITIPTGDYVGDYSGTYQVKSRRISLSTASGGSWDTILEVEAI